MKLLLLLAILAAAYLGWNELPALLAGGPAPLKDSPYVTVYGRDACGITKRMLSDLNRSGIPYTYKIVDDPAVKDELIPRMQQAGLNTRRYGLPVVDVNAEMMIRPKSDVVARKYAQAQPIDPGRARPGRTTTGSTNASAASQLADPIVPCRIRGHDTYTLRSQCPDYAR